MISVESHSKQIKLLNDYILALEKQVTTAKRETEEVQKAGKMSAEDARKLTDELAAAKRENEQLKGHKGKLA
jgi:DNA-directed RNA polymerase subunit F